MTAAATPRHGAGDEVRRCRSADRGARADQALQGRRRVLAQTLHAVDDVDFTIGAREIVALVGESGSGKSTVARLLARVLPARPAGEILYQGRPLSLDAVAPADPGLPRRRADGLPGPVQLAQPGLPGLARDPARARRCTGRSSAAAERRGRGRAGGRGRRARPRPPTCSTATRTSCQRRAAAADRLRPGAGLPAEADPGRRAGVDAGRLDPDRPAQPDGRAARASRASRSSTSPTTSPAPGTSPTGCMVMYAGHIVESGPTEERAGRPEAPVHAAAAVGGAGPAGAAGGARRPTVSEPPRVIDPGDGLPVPRPLPAGGRAVRSRSRRCRGSWRPAHSAACHVAAAGSEAGR